jgi:glycosyltransferase involved in cell wall biosynthesis
MEDRDKVIMEKGPLVSVIIPTYNRVHLVGRAIRSVLEQSYQNFELIIVDDGSTDETEALLRMFQEKDLRIKCIKHGRNEGGSAARNAGIKQAKGKFLVFLDSDDEWLPGKLASEVDVALQYPQYIIYAFGYSFVHEGTGRMVSHLSKKQVVNQKNVLRQECLATNDFMVRKDAIEAIGCFDENLPARQDWDLWIRITSLGQGKQMPLNMVNKYLHHSGQISAGITAKMKGTIMLFEKHRSLFSKDPVACNKILRNIGLMCLINHDAVNAASYFQESLKFTDNKALEIKTTVILSFIKNLGSMGAAILVCFFRLTNPDSYFLR